MKTGIELIAEERQRQINEEGWTSEHDDIHDDSALSLAAMVYCNPDPTIPFIKEFWPFYEHWYKPSPLRYDEENKESYSGRIRELVKAGALIAAEIDKIQRKK